MRLLSILFGIALFIPGGVLACDEAPKFEKGDRTWIKADITVYGLSKKGQLFKTQLSSGKTVVLATHAFSYAKTLKISPSRRYTVYAGVVGDDDSPYYLFDLESGSERVLPGLNVDELDPLFSPASDKLLRTGDSEIVITDVGTLHSEVVFPSSMLSDKASRVIDAEWSQDGGSVYFAILTGKSSTAYEYNVAAARYTPIVQNEDGFFTAGKPLSVFEGPRIQSRQGGAEKASPSGQRVASIQKNSSLTIKDSSGRSVQVDKGGHSACEGDFAVPMAWLDEDYLLFRLHGVPNVYGMKEGRKSVFFDPLDIQFFFW